MLSKAKIKYLNALKVKKYRQKYNNFMAEGDKIALEILQTRSSNILEIFALPDWIDQNRQALLPFEEKVTSITTDELHKISNLQTPNKVVFILETPDNQLVINDSNNNLILFLDQIQDPGNVGTILRIADWFGIPNVVCSPDCAEIYNPKTIQASMGAFLRIQTPILPLAELHARLPELPIYGAVLGGDNLFRTTLSENAIIVIGNESQGISAQVRSLLTHQIEIPARGGAESLNAAIATGIICAVFTNQKP